MTATLNRPAAAPLRRGRPRQGEAKELEERILATALDHFFRHGFEGANMDAIAASVPVTKHTLYQRYESKRGLLLAVRDWRSRSRRDAVDIPLPEGHLRAKLSHLALVMLDTWLTANSVGAGRLIAEIHEIEPGLIDDMWTAEMAHWTGRFRAVLAADPSFAGNDPARLDFLADCFFDILVVGPRVRILTWHILDDTEDAKRAHIEKILDLAAVGIPELKQPEAAR